jgi:hypothetical protein
LRAGCLDRKDLSTGFYAYLILIPNRPLGASRMNTGQNTSFLTAEARKPPLSKTRSLDFLCGFGSVDVWSKLANGKVQCP